MIYYYIDGYNFIFSLIESNETIQTLRQRVIHLLQKKFAQLKLSGTVVFDGSHKRGEESGLSYPSPLIVAYSPKGQSADEYIIEKIESAANPKTMTVVTNDRGLIRHVRSMGAKVQSNSEFIHSLLSRSKKRSEKKGMPSDSKQNIERLLKIFEERLMKNEGLDDFE